LGTWNIFGRVTALLVIMGATIFAIILILLHTRKINESQLKDKEKIMIILL
jgi:hypothetical protein